MAAGRIQPGDTVVEIGAGTCWLSHFLNRYGCRTVSVDVSRTALYMEKQLFERDQEFGYSDASLGEALGRQFGAFAHVTLASGTRTQYHGRPGPDEPPNRFESRPARVGTRR